MKTNTSFHILVLYTLIYSSAVLPAAPKEDFFREHLRKAEELRRQRTADSVKRKGILPDRLDIESAEPSKKEGEDTEEAEDLALAPQLPDGRMITRERELALFRQQLQMEARLTQQTAAAQTVDLEEDPDLQAAVAASLLSEPSISSDIAAVHETQEEKKDQEDRKERFSVYTDPELQSIMSRLPSSLTNHIEALASRHPFLDAGVHMRSTPFPITPGNESDRPSAVTISPDNQHVIIGYSSGFVRSWNVINNTLYRFEADGKSMWFYNMLDGKKVNTIAISTDGHFIVTGSNDHTARLWNAQTRKLIHTFSGHTDAVRSVAISPDNRFIVTSGFDGTLRVWERSTGEQLHSFPRISPNMAITPDSSYIVEATYCRAPTILNIATGTVHRQLENCPVGETLLNVAISNNNQFIVGGFRNGVVCIWDVATGAPLHTLKGHTDAITSIAISNDNQFIITGSKDCTTRTWSVVTGALTHTFNIKSGIFFESKLPINSVAISPNNQFVVAITPSKTSGVRVWKPASYSITASFYLKDALSLRDQAKQTGYFPATQMQKINKGIALLKSSQTNPNSFGSIHQHILNAFNMGKQEAVITSRSKIGKLEWWLGR